MTLSPLTRFRIKKRSQCFTLIELLVVIAIIGIFTGIVLVSLNSAKVRARDAVRARDMQTIYTMLFQYSVEYGGIPGTWTYGGMDAGGWDYSSQPVGTPTFMSFLVNSGIAGKVPVDPINNMPGDRTGGTYAYYYYCYPIGGLALGYISERNNASISRYDPTFTCL